MRKIVLAAQCAIILGSVCAAQVNAFEIKPKGELQLDHAFHDEDVRELMDRGIVRRAEFGFEANFNPDWSAEVVYDFTNGGEFNDAYIEYGGWKMSDIRAGQFKVPFGFERLTSSSDILFIERSLPTEVFAPSRRLGIGFSRDEKHYTFDAMGFDSSIDSDESKGAGARLTFAPINSDNNVVHLGIAAVTEEVDDTVRLRTYPESRPTGFRFVRTGGSLDAVDRVNTVGLEFAWKSGPFSAQAEWMGANVNFNTENSDENFNGWYVAGSWVLTGETRPYKGGRFRGIDPSRNIGAWELAARYSTVDLDNSPIEGGRQRNATVGLNWYAKHFVRISANYIKVNSDRRGVSDNPDIFLVRGQFAF